MEALLVVRWALAFALLTVAGAPLAALAFPRLPRRGAALALPAALVPLALVVFWIGQVTFGAHAVVLGTVVVFGASVVAARSGATPAWRAVAGGYGVFLVGFLALVVVRAYTPGITPAGGEQFLHFGLTKALARAPSLPPEDFWFAGEPLRYYYGTQLQVTAFSLLTRTPLRYGFNLGLAAFYGVLVVTAYGLAGSVAALAGGAYRLGGALGAVFVAVGGALTTAVRLAFGLLPEDVALAYGRPAFGAVRHMPYEEAVVTLSDPGEWGWFFTRYVAPRTLHEFPLYSFLKGDLHGHALSNGYVLLAAALALSYYRTPADRRRRRAALLLGGLGGVAGVFGFMNTWSLPTAVGLAWLALAAADPHPATLLPDPLGRRLARVPSDADWRGARLVAELWRLAAAGVPAAGVGAVGVALASPFLVFGHVPTNDGVGLFPPRTDLAPFLVIYGGLLALFAGYLAYRGWSPARRRWGERGAAVALAALSVGAAVGALTFPVLGVTGPLLLAGWWLVRTGRVDFEGVLLVAGVGLLLSLELVYAKVWPPELVRWNTTLKVAVQAWTLAGAAAGAAAALVLGDARAALACRTRNSVGALSADGGPRLAPSLLAALLVVAVVATSLPFAALAVGDRVVAPAASPESAATLDGLAVHERWHGEEAAAIRWLDARRDATIVEAPGRETYSWSNPAATLTGHPTVVGWDHQQGYRGVGAFERRARQVDRVYAGPWPAAAAVLRSHGVDYVYVGPNEREAYGDDLRSFDRPALSVAFENSAVTIYAVDRSALPANATVGTGTDATAVGATPTVGAGDVARASASRA